MAIPLSNTPANAIFLLCVELIGQKALIASINLPLRMLHVSRHVEACPVKLTPIERLELYIGSPIIGCFIACTLNSDGCGPVSLIVH